MELPIDLSDIKIIKALYNVKSIGYTPIATYLSRVLNMEPRTASRKVDRLISLCKDYKLCFSADYMLYKLGLKLAVYFFDEDVDVDNILDYKIRRCMFKLVPKGIGVVYYLPIEEEPIRPSGASVYELYDRSYTMPDLDAYGIEPLFYIDDIMVDKLFNKLVKETGRLRDYCRGWIFEEFFDKGLKKVKFDWIDLLILKEFEKNPFAKLREIIEHTGLELKRIRRHVKMHILPILKGIRVSLRPISIYFMDTLFTVALRTRDPYYLEGLMHIFQRFPLVTSTGINPFEGLMLVSFTIRFPLARTIYKIFRDLCSEYGFEIIDTRFVDMGTKKSFTIPYKRLEDYNPYDRSWIYLRRLYERLKKGRWMH